MVTILTLCGIAIHWTVNGYLRAGQQAIALQHAIAARYRRADSHASESPSESPSEIK